MTGTESLALTLGFAPGALLLVGCRCGPLLLAVPGLGWAGRGVALVLGTLLAAPLLAPALPAASLLGPHLLPLCLRELSIGAALTLAAALPWAVVYSVGALVDGARVGRPGADRSPLAAPLYGSLALALFFGLGGARVVVTALAASYELLPLLAAPRSPVGAGAASLVEAGAAPLVGSGAASLAGSGAASLAGSGRSLAVLSGQLLGLALRLALPLLGAQLLAELLLALGRSYFAPRPSPSRQSPAAGSLVWLAVLLLGVYALLPQLRQLMALLPGLLRQALNALTPV